MHEGFHRDTGMYFIGSIGQKSLGPYTAKLFTKAFLCSYIGTFCYTIHRVCIVSLANRLKRNLMMYGYTQSLTCYCGLNLTALN